MYLHFFFFKDPNLLATLTPEKLEALSAIADDDLAPPPSQEDIFGKVDAIKCQFQEDSEKISRQLKENQVNWRTIFTSNS